MRRKSAALGTSVALMLCFTLTGCRYGMNRSADFRDIFQFGIGVTAENPVTGPVPPSLGLHLQASEFLNLGAVHFTGLTAEWDGRGLFAGPESRTRIGIGPWQRLQIYQDYKSGSENYFKKEDALWTRRMNSKEMRWWHKPAKELEYNFWANPMHKGVPIMHRGYQHWENFNIELSLSEPFVTHQGLNLKLGFDLSEVFDFLLGFFTLDFKRDDLTQDEYDELKRFQRTGEIASSTTTGEGVPPPGAPVPESAPAEGIRPGSLRPIPEMLVIYFDYDKYNIRSDQVPRAQHNLEFLKANPGIKVQIEGHCDERGTTEYNLALGERRANTMREFFARNGIDPARIRILSKGEEQPVDSGHNEEAWAKNRRDEFLAWE
jgi:peptidoglycan-associated lipoprotein